MCDLCVCSFYWPTKWLGVLFLDHFTSPVSKVLEHDDKRQEDEEVTWSDMPWRTGFLDNCAIFFLCSCCYIRLSVQSKISSSSDVGESFNGIVDNDELDIYKLCTRHTRTALVSDKDGTKITRGLRRYAKDVINVCFICLTFFFSALHFRGVEDMGLPQNVRLRFEVTCANWWMWSCVNHVLNF